MFKINPVIAANEATTQMYNEVIPIGIALGHGGKCLEMLGLSDTQESDFVAEIFAERLIGKYGPFVNGPF